MGSLLPSRQLDRRISAPVDGYVHERMARLASRKHGLRGINWLDRFTWAWLGDLGIYRLTGTVRYPAVHAPR